jgi:hypothetical protein
LSETFCGAIEEISERTGDCTIRELSASEDGRTASEHGVHDQAGHTKSFGIDHRSRSRGHRSGKSRWTAILTGGDGLPASDERMSGNVFDVLRRAERRIVSCELADLIERDGGRGGDEAGLEADADIAAGETCDGCRGEERSRHRAHRAYRGAQGGGGDCYDVAQYRGCPQHPADLLEDIVEEVADVVAEPAQAEEALA